MAKRKQTKGQTTINKTLQKKLMCEQHKPGMNAGAPDE